jgi:hypothetical protein
MKKNDEEKRTEELKRQAEQPGMLATWDSGDLSPHQRERFWHNVIAFETAPLTTLSQQVHDAGCEEIPWSPVDPLSAWHLQFTSGSDEDTDAYLRYYADDDERRQWLVDFPDYVMPPHEDLPYDRDRHLPVP